MATFLQTRLKQLMQEKSLTTSDLEKLAGLKISAVRNILLGRTKRPKAETLQAIVEVLGCTIGELLGKELPPAQETIPDSLPLEHRGLLLEATQSLINLLEKEGKSITLDQAWLVIKETYTYAVQQDPKVIEERFVKWLLSKQA